MESLLSLPFGYKIDSLFSCSADSAIHFDCKIIRGSESKCWRPPHLSRACCSSRFFSRLWPTSAAFKLPLVMQTYCARHAVGCGKVPIRELRVSASFQSLTLAHCFAFAVSFDKGSEGTVSTLFYEFSDFPTIGKDSKEHDILGFPVRMPHFTAGTRAK